MTDNIDILHRKLLITILLMALCSCGGRRPVSPDDSKATVTRFDLDVFRYPDMDSAARNAFRDSYARVLPVLLMNTAVSDSAVNAYANSRAVKVFTPDIMSRYDSHDSVEKVLGAIMAAKHRLMPELQWPRMYGIVSPYNQSIIMTDSIMLIGLNHYLGADYEGYGYFDSYLRHIKTARHMPYHIVEAVLAGSHPFIPDEKQTALSRMLYEGALLKSIEMIMPGFNLADALGYDSAQLDLIKSHEADIWNTLIAKRLLFSTVATVADRLVNPAPYTSIIGPEVPGRAGRYIGYRIVDSYLRHNDVTGPQDILSSDFYNSRNTLVKSEYSPR